MTFLSAREKQKRPVGRVLTGQVLFGLFSVFCLLLILRNANIAITYMSRGLHLCARTVVPSLFPFMVLSELIVSAGIVNRLPNTLLAPFRRLWGVSNAGGCAVILGMLCGFPIGAKCAVRAYEEGQMTQEETERVLCFSNNPSSAFLISTVGFSLWGNRRFGTALYATVLGVSALTGVALNLTRKRHQKNTLAGCDVISRSISAPKGARLFTEAIKSATGSMLLVCAYVIFFSTLVGTLGLVLNAWHAPTWVCSVLFCLFELSGGVSQASALDPPLLAALFCAFSAGWSGLSVHCQVLSVCDGKGLSFRKYFLCKLAQGLLCALFFGLVLHLFPDLTVPAQGV